MLRSSVFRSALALRSTFGNRALHASGAVAFKKSLEDLVVSLLFSTLFTRL